MEGQSQQNLELQQHKIKKKNHLICINIFVPLPHQLVVVHSYANQFW